MDKITIDVDVAGLSANIAALTQDGEKSPVVFLHGFGSTKEDYVDAAFPGRLSEHRIIAFDLPGCGATRCSDLSALNMTTIRDVVDEALRLAGVDRFHLAGHSLGGLIGLLLAEKRQRDMLSFTSIEGNLAPSDCFFSRQIITHPGASPDDFLKRFQARMRAENVYSYGLYAEAVEHKVRAKAVAPIFRSMVETSDCGDLLSTFLCLPCPTMLLYGDVNRSLPYLGKLTDNGVRLAEIPESGHFPMYSNPPAMWAALRGFIDDVDSGAFSGRE